MKMRGQDLSFTHVGYGHAMMGGTSGLTMKAIVLLLVALVLSLPDSVARAEIEDRYYWRNQAKDHLEEVLSARRASKGYAKNVILFVGDGMGVSTVTAGRILKGQRQGQSGEEYKLSFEKFPFVALSKTYTVDSQIGDSSACATALMCGVKANVNTVGLDHRGKFEDCTSSYSSRVTSLIDWAQKHGKSTGIVTNTRLTHGTPSALYAHSPSRYWEDDERVPNKSRSNCKDIARQLVEDEPGRSINVLLGGGRRHWIPSTEFDPEERDMRGRRTDTRNLIDKWVHDKKSKELLSEYVWNKTQFDSVDPRRTDYLLGIFGHSHLDFEVDRNKGPKGDPSLAEMTVKAIQILNKNPHGFFLMVENGRLDHAHHHSNGRRALEEVGVLDDLVTAALDLVDQSETLLVVTADHSHVFTFGGNNTPRGNPILAGRLDHAHHYNMASRALDEVGRLDECVKVALKMTGSHNTLLVVTADHSHTMTFGGASVPRGNAILGTDSEMSDLDGKPYTTLLYGNGPGYAHSTPLGRQNISEYDTQSINFVQQAAVPRKYETHGGEDVPVYAHGPGAHLFTGTVEQTYIAHAIAHAACISDDNTHCEKPPSDDACAAAPAPALTPTSRRPLGHDSPSEKASGKRNQDLRSSWSAGAKVYDCALAMLFMPIVFVLR